MLVLLFSPLIAQPAKTEVAQKKENINDIPFDSTWNWLGDKNVYSYKGQELYVLPKMAGFLELKSMNFTSMTSSVASGFSYGTDGLLPYADMDLVADRVFVVDSVYKHQRETGKYVFVMHFKDSPAEKCQFLYDARFDFNFPFLVMSYYNYLVDRYTSKEMICWNKIHDSDVETGEQISFIGDYMEWECYGVSIIDDVVINLRNKQDGKKTFVSVKSLYLETVRARAFLKEDWTMLVKKYGLDMMECVMKGTIKIGMPVELLKMSWGLPNTVNAPSYGDEQWVYKKDYVYVKDGKVTAWN